MAIVLFVDGDVTSRRRLGSSLREAGYEVVEADGAEAALGALSRRHVDVALIDMRLPGAEGLELCQAIRRGWKTRVVALSPPTMTTDAVAFLDAGADDYVTKPVAPAVLTARVRSLLRRVDDHDGRTRATS